MTIGVQTPLHELYNQFTQNHTAVGAAGELIVARALISSGYEVSTIGKRADLTVFDAKANLYHIEIKTARYSSGMWQFCLTRKGHTDHRKADILILLCACKSGYAVPFVLPVSAVWDNRNISMREANPQAYTGKYARYRQSLRSLTLDSALRELGLIHD